MNATETPHEYGVRGTGNENDPGILRINFPGGAGEESLEHMSWDDWFEKLEQNDPAFPNQGEKPRGEESAFYESKLIKR